MVKLSGLLTIFLFTLLHVATLISGLSKLDFPPEFVFGAGTSAYQVEGAVAEDGRKPSIWDTFTHQGRSYDKHTGDIASDQYHHYKEDVKLMYEMGLDAYRFSISWSRLIPDGRGAVNPKGLTYYNNLINELISYGIEAHVTLSHFDIPQALQDEYGGYLSPKLIEDFTAYADICFQEYGDRVKTWVTFNEPNLPGYGFTSCSSPFDVDCIKREQMGYSYIFGHNLLLAHAAAVNLYRTTYQEKQKGKIGITLLSIWFEPPTESVEDITRVALSRDSTLGWFLGPLVNGRYPSSMMKNLGSRLPNITVEDSKRIKGAFDFIGMNNYGGLYMPGHFGNSSKNGLLGMDFTMLKDDSTTTLTPCLPEILEYVKEKYNNPTVVIHENGYRTTVDDWSDPSARNDTARVELLQRNIKSLLQPIRNGSDVRGYFVWSFMDVFESFGGYTSKYGLYGVDFNDKSRRRYPRQSAHWYSSFLAKRKSGMNTGKFVYVDSE
ncbi:beta-glucosidase [Ranunculus cassubicifolius]